MAAGQGDRGRPAGRRRRSFWPLGCLTAIVAVLALLRFGPSAATWWHHRVMSSAVSEVELGPLCERTAELREGDAIGIFATPPSLTVTYTCPGMSATQTRDAADAALRAGDFALTSAWYAKTSRVEVSSWTGHGARVIANADNGEIELTLERD